MDRTEFVRETLPATGWVLLLFGSTVGTAAGGAWVMTLIEDGPALLVLLAWLGVSAVAAAVAGAVWWAMTR